ncbi:hypothetical protein GCM10011607_12130 [Shewanella inventionis]|uniref:DUF4919 domain-containing protein n=1 Tax=Shewanella inventionis TaxID=1738770 RepID=A0ABQ1IXX7_9GAMM|nr:hypothetical protein [Shewanella inventionis]GGB53180.1 hypothetical protein GCM10011607_12130 [Shewanella inventionis]
MLIRRLTLAMLFSLSSLSANAEVVSPVDVQLVAPNTSFYQNYTAQYSFMYKFTENELKALIMNYNEVVASAKTFNQAYIALAQNQKVGEDWSMAKRSVDDAYTAFVRSGNKLAVQDDTKSVRSLNRLFATPKAQYMDGMKTLVLALEDSISSYMTKGIRNSGKFGSRVNSKNLVITLDSSTPFNVIIIGAEGSGDAPIIKFVDTSYLQKQRTLNIKDFETIASFSTRLANYYIQYSAAKNYRENVSK